MKISFSLALFACATQAKQLYPAQPHHKYGSNPWERSNPDHGYYGHGYYNNHKEPEVPEGWYSAYEQYSPPRIPFEPSKAVKKPTYGVCSIPDKGIEMKFGQNPWYPTSSIGTISANGGYMSGTTISTFINTFGKDTDNCDNNQPEFNPLDELIDGIPNPYQDPTRGRIDSLTVGDDGTVTSTQVTLLQNLRGENGILGKSLTFTGKLPNGEEFKIGCCVIGEDMPPMNVEPEEEEEAERDQHGHHGNHGHHGHYQQTGGHYGHGQHQPSRHPHAPYYPQAPQAPNYFSEAPSSHFRGRYRPQGIPQPRYSGRSSPGGYKGW